MCKEVLNIDRHGNALNQALLSCPDISVALFQKINSELAAYIDSIFNQVTDMTVGSRIKSTANKPCY